LKDNLAKKAYPRFKREKSVSEKGHYITNKVLLPEVNRAKALGYVTSELMEMIKLISERTASKYNWAKYSYREDFVAEAVANLCKRALVFDRDELGRTNPFAYYTSAIENSFKQFIKDEGLKQAVKDALLIQAGSNPSYNFLEGEKDESFFEIKDSDEAYEPVKINVIHSEYLEKLEKGVKDLNVVGIEIEDDKIVPANSIKYRSRVPSQVVTYSADEVEIDPVTFEIRIIELQRDRSTAITKNHFINPYKLLNKEIK
jgi:hypothetical protein